MTGRHTTAAPPRPADFTVLVDQEAGTWRRDAEWEGDERVLVEVWRLGPELYRLACPIYYAPDGVLELAISQPEERAIRTFVALLRADSELETSR